MDSAAGLVNDMLASLVRGAFAGMTEQTCERLANHYGARAAALGMVKGEMTMDDTLLEFEVDDPEYPTRPCPVCNGRRVAAQLHNEYGDDGSIVHTRVLLRCMDCGRDRWFENLEAGMHHWLDTDEDGNVRFAKDGLDLKMRMVR